MIMTEASSEKVSDYFADQPLQGRNERSLRKILVVGGFESFSFYAANDFLLAKRTCSISLLFFSNWLWHGSFIFARGTHFVPPKDR